jgi:hypothetical protein
MKKGKGTESLLPRRCRSFMAPGRPVLTRLTRTMAFIEVPFAPCASGSIDASDADDPEPGVWTTGLH